MCGFDWFKIVDAWDCVLQFNPFSGLYVYGIFNCCFFIMTLILVFDAAIWVYIGFSANQCLCFVIFMWLLVLFLFKNLDLVDNLCAVYNELFY